MHLPIGIERGLRVLGIKVSELGGIACVRGPGSFTGLRIAHATMYGLARPFALPMASLEYPAILAEQVSPLIEGEVWVLTYARKSQIYVQGYAKGRQLTDIRTLSVSEAIVLLSERPTPAALVGSGLRKNSALLEIPNATVLPAHFDTPHPQFLFRAACAATFNTDPPVPLYLRKSDAEDNLEAIARSRGLSLEEARQHIFDFE